jgi:hypothetical protein
MAFQAPLLLLISAGWLGVALLVFFFVVFFVLPRLLRRLPAESIKAYKTDGTRKVGAPASLPGGIVRDNPEESEESPPISQKPDESKSPTKSPTTVSAPPLVPPPSPAAPIPSKGDETGEFTRIFESPLKPEATQPSPIPSDKKASLQKTVSRVGGDIAVKRRPAPYENRSDFLRHGQENGRLLKSERVVSERPRSDARTEIRNV